MNDGRMKGKPYVDIEEPKETYAVSYGVLIYFPLRSLFVLSGFPYQ
jgi:hypothetical protein